MMFSATRLKRRMSAGVVDRKGSAAVEFALIAPMFLALLFSIFEAGYFFFANSAVDQAAARAARLIRTGQAQDASSPISADDFYNEICDVVKLFGSCSTRLTVDVDNYASFDALAADLAQPVCRDSSDPSIQGTQFSSSDYGAQRSIVRVRICYLHKTINPALGLHLDKTADGFRELIAVAIFRNEPYDS